LPSVIELDLKTVERHVVEHPPALGVSVSGGLPRPPGFDDVIMPELPPPKSNPWDGKP
jgi:hypothetical protein